MCKDNANRAENIQVYLKCLTEMQLILLKDNANRAENIQVYLKMFDREKKSVCQSITALHTPQEKNAYETLIIFLISLLPPTTILLTFRALSFHLLPPMKSAVRKWHARLQTNYRHYL